MVVKRKICDDSENNIFVLNFPRYTKGWKKISPFMNLYNSCNNKSRRFLFFLLVG